MLSLESLALVARLLVAAEIAQLLTVSDKTVYQWVELNQIPHLKINGSVRFNPKAIAIWLETCKKGPLLNYNRTAQSVASVREGGKN